MAREATAFADTRGLRLVTAQNEHDTSSMQDIGKTYRKTEWLDAVRVQLSAIKDLDVGWDGYGAREIPTDTVLFTCQVLTDIWLPGLPVPDISPMSNEGIMVEWITQQFELTVEINAPYSIQYIFENLQTGEIYEDTISQDTRRLDPFLRQVRGIGENAAVA